MSNRPQRMSREEQVTLLFLLFMIWNILDAALTLSAVSWGIASEQNAVLRLLPIGYAMLFKVSLALLIGSVWIIQGKMWKLALGAILIYLTCIWNILVIQGVIVL